MEPPQPDDYRWLVSAAARPWLESAGEAAAAGKPLVQTVQRLRKELSASRAHLVLDQVELRVRGREKFPHAERMFFTRVGFEQATDAELATYKATRYVPGERVGDFCCGIGGDLAALAARGPVLGVDRDVGVSILAAANVPAAEVVAADAQAESVLEVAAWHIDPDRRAAGTRTTRVEYYSPPAAALDAMREVCPDGAIKLAPAAEVSEGWSREAECEWISSRGECRQQVAWFGRLARRPGESTATVLTAGRPPRTVNGGARLPVLSRPLGAFLFEPDAAVLAAELTGALALEHGLGAIAPGGVYLTGDAPLCDPALAIFQIVEVLPFDRRRLKSYFRERGVGRLEIKKRGVDVTPEELRRALDLRGEETAVLIVTPIGERVAAIVAQRTGL